MFNGVEALKKMTRETKVGLIVAGSFLCLVGAVLFFKLRDGGPPPEVEEQVVLDAPREEQQKAGSSEAGALAQAGSTETNPALSPSPAGGAGASPPLDNGGPRDPSLFPVQDPQLLPPPPVVVQTSGNQTPTNSSGGLLGGGPVAPPAPAPPPTQEAAPGSAIISPPSASAPDEAGPANGGDADAARRVRTGDAMPAPTPLEGTPPQRSGGSNIDALPPPAQPLTLDGPGNAPPPGQAPGTASPPPVDPAGTTPGNRDPLPPPTGDIPPSVPVERSASDPINERSAPPVAPVHSGEPPPGASAVDPRTAPTPANLGAPVPDDGGRATGLGTDGTAPPVGGAGQMQPAATIPPAGRAAPSVTGVNVQPSPGAAGRGVGLNDNSPAPLPPASTGAAAPAATPLPAGTPVGASAPPITIPASRGPARPATRTPQVESYDEEEYRAKAGDTFQTISMRFYRTDRYAPALLLYNRSHPLGSLGVRQEPPALQAGQPVFIPPTNILEKRHGAAVPDLTPLTPGRVAPVPERRSNASPGAAAGGALQYRIPGEGEMMWEIARRTLQNGDRWKEIHKLNPSLRPELPIARGTVINLPPDAQVDAANRP